MVDFFVGFSYHFRKAYLKEIIDRIIVMREQVTREKIIFQSPAKDHERIIFVFISYNERYQLLLTPNMINR